MIQYFKFLENNNSYYMKTEDSLTFPIRIKNVLSIIRINDISGSVYSLPFYHYSVEKEDQSWNLRMGAINRVTNFLCIEITEQEFQLALRSLP